MTIMVALVVASQDAWVKKQFSHLSFYEMMAFPLLYSLPLFTATAFFVPVPPLDPTFYWAFGFSIPLNAFSFLLYTKAIKISPLSLTVPYLAFTPTFAIFTGILFL